MPTIGPDPIATAIDVGYQKLAISKELPRPTAGAPRVALGICTIYPQLIPIAFPSSTEAHPRSNFLNLPHFHSWPNAFLLASLCHAPRLDFRTVPADGAELLGWLSERRRQDNPDLILEVVKLSTGYCAANGFKDGSRRITQTHLERLRLYRKLLDAQRVTPTPDRDLLDAARKYVEDNLRNHAGNQIRFPDLWRDFQRRRRNPWTVLGALRQRGAPTHPFRNAIRATARTIAQPDPEDTESPQEWLADEQGVEIDSLYPGRAAAASLRKQASFLVTPCPLPRAFSQAETLFAIQVAAREAESHPSAAAVAAMAHGLVGFEALGSAKWANETDGNRSYRVDLAAMHQGPPPNSRGLYRPSVQEMWRAVPAKVGELLMPGLTTPRRREAFRADIEAWFRARMPSATLAKFAQALTHQGPSWWGYPWILVYAGHRATLTQCHAARSYCQISPDINAQAARFCAKMFPDWPRWWDAAGPTPGSALVPTDAAAHMIASRIRTLSGQAPAEDPDTAFAQLLTLGAAMHWLTLIYTGVRNRPFHEPLPRAILLAPPHWVILEQKGQKCPMFLPRPCLKWMIPLRSRWETALKPVGKRLWLGDQAHLPLYGIPSATADGGICIDPPTPDLIVQGFALDDVLREFVGLNPRAWRHWTNTVLRESGLFSEPEVRAYHHHHLSAFHPLARHRAEDPLGIHARERMAAHIATRLGLE